MDATAPTKTWSTKAHPRILRDQALALWCAGLPLPTIADQLGLPALTLKTWCKRYQWSQTRSQVEEMTVGNAKRAMIRALAEVGQATRESLASSVQAASETLQQARKAKTVRGVKEVGEAVQVLTQSAKVLHGWDQPAKPAPLVQVEIVGAVMRQLYPQDTAGAESWQDNAAAEMAGEPTPTPLEMGAAPN